MKIHWFALLFRNVFDANASLQARGWVAGVLIKDRCRRINNHQVLKRGLQTPWLFQTAFSGILGTDTGFIHSHAPGIRGVVMGARALSDEDEVWVKVKMRAQNLTQILCKPFPHFDFCQWHLISLNHPGLKPRITLGLFLCSFPHAATKAQLSCTYNRAAQCLSWSPRSPQQRPDVVASCPACCLLCSSRHPAGPWPTCLGAQCAYAPAPLRNGACHPLVTNSRTMHSTDRQDLERAPTCFSVSVP